MVTMQQASNAGMSRISELGDRLRIGAVLLVQL
jgi:hypothetical protein